MKYVKILGLLAVAAAVMMAFAGSASATSVTTTTGGAASTPTIHAVNEGGHVVLANSIANIECSSTSEGAVESHGAGKEASGKLTKLEFTGCTNSWHVTVSALGSLSVAWTSGHNGTAKSTGTKVTTTRLGVTCNYETNNTDIGTVTGGNPATLDISASIPIAAGSSGLCGTGNAKWSGSYSTTSGLYVSLAGMNISPDPVIFAGQKTEKIVAIENTGGVTIKNLEVFVFPEGTFEATKKCKETSLEPGTSCEETVKCLKFGENATLVASSSEPLVAASSELECHP